MVDNNLDKYTIIVEEQDNYTIELNEQGPQGLRGIQGEVGPTGPKGDAATISIGKVETGDPGTLASVTNIGTLTDSVLDFVIPRGDEGKAATIVVGSTTTSESGTEANVVNSGDENMAILEFTIPKGSKGDKGDTGLQGPQGPQGIQGIQGPQGVKGDIGPSNELSIGTVESGTIPSVTITGNSPSQILNFVLPKGDKGDKGDTGYGMPTGGATGQILSKHSDTNYDVEWIDNNPSSLEVMYDKDNRAIKFIDSTNIVTFTITPTPSDATVVITSGTCNQVGNSITVPKNSLVEYTVSKDGMITKSGYLNVVEDTSMDIKLNLPPVSLTINNTTDSETTLTYNNGYEENSTTPLGANKSVTINAVPNTIIKATASGLGKGTYFILTNTSGSIDYTPWAAAGGGGGAWAYCYNSIKTVNSTDSISLTYNDTLTGGSNTITGTGSASNTSGDYGISTPISITTTSSTNTYTFNYNPNPTETYSFGGVFALIDTNGVGSVVSSSSSGGRPPGSGGGGDDF